ncbi:MAG: outer membrane beta-barrel protein [Rikenellaceae bacterium]
MRNIILTIFIASVALAKISAQNKDTIATFNVDGNEKITLRQNDKNGGVTIDLAGYEIVFGEHKGAAVKTAAKSKKKTDKVKFSILTDINMGFTTLISSDYTSNTVDDKNLLDLNQGKSIYFSSNLVGISAPLDSKGALTLKTGINLKCFNFTFADDITIDYQDGKIVTVDIDESNKKSKLTTAYLGVPLSLSLKVKNKFYIEPGVYAGLNINAHTKYKRPIVKNGNIKGINPVIAGAMLKVRYNKIGFFGDYTFTNVFRNDVGPKAKVFSVGLTLSL